MLKLPLSLFGSGETVKVQQEEGVPPASTALKLKELLKFGSWSCAREGVKTTYNTALTTKMSSAVKKQSVNLGSRSPRKYKYKAVLRSKLKAQVLKSKGGLVGTPNGQPLAGLTREVEGQT